MNHYGRHFNRRDAILFVVCCFVHSTVAQAQQQQRNKSELENLTDVTVQRILSDFQVPGVAIAVVKDGTVVLAKGYGVRGIDIRDSVTEHTMAAIASNTKLFTSAALAMLVDEGKLGWDDRVIDRLPEFAMSDPYVTREMRIRDLPCHRSGLALGAGDLLYFPGTNFSPADIVFRLRFLPLAYGFRERFAYDNILYVVMGQLIAKMSGKPWDDFIRERFFVPLGMNSSRTSIRQVSPTDNVMLPHAIQNGVLTALQHTPRDNRAPAGSIVSSALDMARWISTLLNGGVTPDGKRLISEAQLRTLFAPLVLLQRSDPPEEIHEMRANFSSYGMGAYVSEYRGRSILTHTGGTTGMASSVAMLPELKLGLVVLTNQQAPGAFYAVQNTILDHFLGGTGKDWVSAFASLRKRVEERTKKTLAKHAASRNSESRPSLPTASYAGRYRDPWYGDVFVSRSNGKLAIRFANTPKLEGTLEHWQYDTFVARWNDRSLDADAYVSFQLDSGGKVERIAIRAISPLTDFSFDFHDLRLTPVALDAAPWD